MQPIAFCGEANESYYRIKGSQACGGIPLPPNGLKVHPSYKKHYFKES
jgi:hypothetical protein